MTKRDVAVGICRAIALMGMSEAAFGLAQMVGLRYGVNSGSVRVHSFVFWQPMLPFGMFLFVWFFARGLGAELVAPREADEAVTSNASLTSLLVRGVGLWLFLGAAVRFGPTLLGWAYQHFVDPPPLTMAFPVFIDPRVLTNLIVGLAQAVAGFGLAFTPRLRAHLRG